MKEEKSTKVSEKESLPERSRVDIQMKLLNKERSEIAARHLQGGGRGPEGSEKEENEKLGKNCKEHLERSSAYIIFCLNENFVICKTCERNFRGLRAYDLH